MSGSIIGEASKKHRRKLQDNCAIAAVQMCVYQTINYVQYSLWVFTSSAVLMYMECRM